MRWLTGYAETIPAAGGRLQSRRPVYPLLLERLAPDGEWEPVDRLDLSVPNLDSYTRCAFWRNAEKTLAERHHVHVDRGYTVDSRPVVAC